MGEEWIPLGVAALGIVGTITVALIQGRRRDADVERLASLQKILAATGLDSETQRLVNLAAGKVAARIALSYRERGIWQRILGVATVAVFVLGVLTMTLAFATSITTGVALHEVPWATFDARNAFAFYPLWLLAFTTVTAIVWLIIESVKGGKFVAAPPAAPPSNSSSGGQTPATTISPGNPPAV